MDALESLFRPVISLINKQIKATTPARELCAELDAKIIAVRVKDTSLAMFFCVCPDEIALFGDFDGEPDVVITGSILTLARLAGAGGQDALRDGSLDLTGDAEVAQSFQKLLLFGKPDIEEELSGIIGDVAAHHLGEVARGVGTWAREAGSTIRQNIAEYIVEERRDVPSRHEVETFTRLVDALRDDVARFEARLNRLERET
ncbi:MAG: SCP2 domain-containing protein [Woeseia sp.]